MAKQPKQDVFQENIFRYNFQNGPIPKLVRNQNARQLADAVGTNSILFTIVDKKASFSSNVKPEILGKTKDKAGMKEYLKWNGKYKKKYEIKQLNKLKEAAFEPIEFSDINESSELYFLKNLLTRPNPEQTFAQFLYAYSFWMDNGWSALYKWKPDLSLTGKTQRLYALPTTMINIIGGSDYFGGVQSYRFDYNDSTKDIPAEEIIRISQFSPRYDLYGGHLYGLSRIEAAWSEFQNYAQAVEREFSSFSGGDLRAILFPKDPMALQGLPSDEKGISAYFQKFKDGLLRAFSQKGESKIAIVPSQLEAIQMQQDLRDNVTTKAKEKSMQIACAVFQMEYPAVFPDLQGTTFDNQQEYVAKSIRNGVFPDLRRLEENLREYLVEKEYPNVTFSFDYDVYDELVEDIATEIEGLRFADYLTDNEKREFLSYEPLEEERANVPRAYWNELIDPMANDNLEEEGQEDDL